MSVQQQANMSSPWPGANGAKAHHPGAPRRGSRGGASTVATFVLVMVCGLLFGGGLAYLAKHSSGQVSGSDSSNNTSSAGGSAEARSVVDSIASEAVVPVSQLPITGSQYEVVAEKAFFFQAPGRPAPLTRYLRRGDVFYANADSNGFVRTRFVQANGDESTGWLNARELREIAQKPAPPVAAVSTAPTALAVASRKKAPVRQAAPRPRAAQSRARQPGARSRVGAWLRRTREKVLPRRQDTNGAKRKKKAPPCKCAYRPPALAATGWWA